LSAPKNEGLREPPATIQTPPTTAAAHTFDHAAKKWDTFDADSALAELSDDDGCAAQRQNGSKVSPLASK
jgi:hypothetical protein